MIATRLAVPSLVLLAALACKGPAPEPVELPAGTPTLADLDTADIGSLVDRTSALAGATDPDVAEEGALLDLTDAGSGYLMEIDGTAITSNDFERTYTNWTSAVVATVAADLIVVGVTGPPAIGIGIAANGEIEQLAPNVWRATNDVPIGGDTWTAQLTVSWVGVGWVSEMRYSNSTVTDALWFNGFVSNRSAVGWWDLYDASGTRAGVVEWATDGSNGELGMLATAGENAGDYLLYTHLGDFHRIDHHDESEGVDRFVRLEPDLSGGVQLPGLNGGLEACWDTTFNDVACEEADADTDTDSDTDTDTDADSDADADTDTDTDTDADTDVACAAGTATAEVEPNDDENTATCIASGVSAQGSITVVGDEDWYTLDVTGGSILEVHLTDAPTFFTNVDYGFTLWDSTVSEIDSEWDSDGTDGVTTIVSREYAPTTGPYHVSVWDLNGNDSGPLHQYTLTVTERPDPDTAFEPNGFWSNAGQTMATATPVISGVPRVGHIAWRADHDVFAIPIGGEGIVRVDLTNAPAFDSEVDLGFTLYDTDASTEIRSRWVSDGTAGTATLATQEYVPASGTLYLDVWDLNDNGWDDAQPFTVTLTELPDPDAAVEPNGYSSNPGQTMATATPVASGVAATGHIATRGDHDVHAITVSGESILRVELTNAPAFTSAVDLGFTVYETDAETEIQSRWVSDGTTGTTTLATQEYAAVAGTYYVDVWDLNDDDWDDAQPYQLTVTEVPVPDAAQEPNGNATPSTLQAIATPYAGPMTGWIASRSDEDCFAVPSGAGSLSVSLTNAPAFSSAVDLGVTLYDTDAASVLAWDWVSDGSTGTAALSIGASVTAGTYYVCVWDVNDDDWDIDQPYTLTVTAP